MPQEARTPRSPLILRPSCLPCSTSFPLTSSPTFETLSLCPLNSLSITKKIPCIFNTVPELHLLAVTDLTLPWLPGFLAALSKSGCFLSFSSQTLRHGGGRSFGALLCFITNIHTILPHFVPNSLASSCFKYHVIRLCHSLVLWWSSYTVLSVTPPHSRKIFPIGSLSFSPAPLLTQTPLHNNSPHSHIITISRILLSDFPSSSHSSNCSASMRLKTH